MTVLSALGSAFMALLSPLLRLADTAGWQQAFCTLLNLTVNGSWAVAAVLLARLLLRKAPRRYSYLLWAAVGFRFCCPVSFQSVFSLLPSGGGRAIPADLGVRAIPRVNTGAAALDAAVNALLPTPDPNLPASANPLQLWLFAGSAVWGIGILALLIAALVSTRRLHKRVQGAAALPTGQNTLCNPGRSPLWRMANAAPAHTLPGGGTAFVYGVLRPRIYLPEHLSPAARRCVLLHERTHLARADHLVKLLAFCLLCLHWFNPLAWLAFRLLERDMEESCDEAVLDRLDGSADYAQSLLDLAAHRTPVGLSPVAFGESEATTRIRRALGYKRPAAWVGTLALALAAVLSFGLSADPLVQKTGNLIDGEMRQTSTLSQFGITVPVHQPSLADRTDWEIAAAEGVMEQAAQNQTVESDAVTVPHTLRLVEIEEFGNGKLIVLADLQYADDPHTVYRQRYTYAEEDGSWKLADISY